MGKGYHEWGTEPYTAGTYTVYAICCPDTDEIRYVGITGQNPYKRFSQHLAAVNGSQKQSRLYFWLRNLKAAGKEPKFRVLETDIPRYAWEEAEQLWISRLQPELNDQPGGVSWDHWPAGASREPTR